MDDEQKYYDTTITIVFLGKLAREEQTKDSRSTTQVTEQPIISQKMDECPKARKDNELGLEMTLLNLALLGQNEDTSPCKLFSHGRYFSIVINEQIV